MLCYGPLVSELGGRVHGAPQLRQWGGGAVPHPAPAPPPIFAVFKRGSGLRRQKKGGTRMEGERGFLLV